MNAAEELGEIFMLWKATEKAFLQHLLIRLIRDLPDFNYEKFALGLQLLQEEWPIDRSDKVQESQGLASIGFLGELIEMTEGAIATARAA